MDVQIPRVLNRAQFGILLIFAGAGLLFLCTKVYAIRVTTDGGGTSVYRTGITGNLLAGAAAVALAGSAVAFATAKIGILRVFALLPLLLAAVMTMGAYVMFRGHVSIGPAAVEVPAYGLSGRHHTLAYAELGGVVIDDEAVEFVRKDRSKVVVPRGDLVRASLEDLVPVLESHGVAVDDNAVSGAAGR